jgi:hypothetical protein
MVFIVIERNESVKTVESVNKKSFYLFVFPRGPRAPRGLERLFVVYGHCLSLRSLRLRGEKKGERIREICGIRGWKMSAATRPRRSRRLGVSVKIKIKAEKSRSPGLPVRRRRDRHPKWPVESGDSPSRPPGGGMRSQPQSRPQSCPHLAACEKKKREILRWAQNDKKRSPNVTSQRRDCRVAWLLAMTDERWRGRKICLHFLVFALNYLDVLPDTPLIVRVSQ